MQIQNTFDPINLGVGLVSGVFQGIGANKRQKRAIKAQQEENQKNRDYNLMLYERQLKDSRENIAQERAYNSPLAVANRMTQAGLNKDLAYGSGAGSLIDSNVAQTPTTHGSNPSPIGDYISNTPLLSDSILQGIVAMREIAETKHINSETAKNEGELTSINLDNFVKSATTGQSIQLAQMEVNLSQSYLSLNDAKRAEVLQTVKNLEAMNENINASTANLKSSTGLLDQKQLSEQLTRYLNSARFENECSKLQKELQQIDAHIHVERATVQQILQDTVCKKLGLSSEIMLRKSQARLNNANEKYLNALEDTAIINGNMLRLNYSNGVSYDSFERQTKILSTVLNSCGSVIKGLF